MSNERKRSEGWWYFIANGETEWQCVLVDEFGVWAWGSDTSWDHDEAEERGQFWSKVPVPPKFEWVAGEGIVDESVARAVFSDDSGEDIAARFAAMTRHQREHCNGFWTQVIAQSNAPGVKEFRAAMKARGADLFNASCGWCVAERERGER